MQNYTNINSKLYSELFELGGDNLISVYAILKFAKNGAIKIYKEENRNIFHTLKTKTNLSITTLRKYIKILSKEGLCHFDKAGNFVLKGIKILYQRHKSIYPYGYPFSFVPNMHHQNVLIFQNIKKDD